MYTVKKLRYVSFVVALALLLTLFAGCGARVTTVMTVDEKFSGTRVITLTINPEDMQYVTGGKEALNKVVKANLPKDLTYTSAKDEAGQISMVFILSFSGLEDYRAKVGRLIALDKNNKISPMVKFETQNTKFKKGVKVEENFSSADLMKWLLNAVEAAKIVTEGSASNWYEMGTDKLVMGGQTYTMTGGHNINLNKQTDHCLNRGEVTTTLLPDGKIQRVISLIAYKDTVKEFEEANGSLKDYMASVAKDGITFEAVTKEHENTWYNYTFTAANAEEVVAKTNAILQTKTNAFSLEISPKEEKVGMATIKLTEALDGSYYFSNNAPFRSKFVLYTNAKKVKGPGSYGERRNEFIYNPIDTVKNEFLCDWQVSFKDVSLEMKARNAKKMDMKLTFTADETLPENIRAIAMDALEKAAKDTGKFKKKGASATLSFSGKTEKVAAQVNGFVKNYVTLQGDTPKQDNSYCVVSLDTLNTPSKFTKGTYGDMRMSLGPVLGDMKLKLVTSGGLSKMQITSDVSKDEEGNQFVGANMHVSFTLVRMNFLTVIFTVLFVALLVAGVLIAILRRDDFKHLFEKKAPVAVAAPMTPVQQPQVAQNAAAPAEPHPAPVETPAEPQQEPEKQDEKPAQKDEEEEEIL